MSAPEYETGTVDAVADADEVVVRSSQHWDQSKVPEEGGQVSHFNVYWITFTSKARESTDWKAQVSRNIKRDT